MFHSMYQEYYNNCYWSNSNFWNIAVMFLLCILANLSGAACCFPVQLMVTWNFAKRNIYTSFTKESDYRICMICFHFLSFCGISSIIRRSLFFLGFYMLKITAVRHRSVRYLFCWGFLIPDVRRVKKTVFSNVRKDTKKLYRILELYLEKQ